MSWDSSSTRRVWVSWSCRRMAEAMPSAREVAGQKAAAAPAATTKRRLSGVFLIFSNALAMDLGSVPSAMAPHKSLTLNNIQLIAESQQESCGVPLNVDALVAFQERGI